MRKPPEERQTNARLLALICTVSFLEGGDEVLLPATQYALNHDLGITLPDLGTLFLMQALCQALCAPVWGILMSRSVLTRRAVLVLGSGGWGVITLLMATVPRGAFKALVGLRAVNGAMLACLSPTVQGLVADTTSEGRRGRVFGCIFFALNIGKMSMTLMATMLSHKLPFGVQGWRVAFGFLGAVSLVVGIAVAIIMVEPPRETAAPSPDDRLLTKHHGTTWSTRGPLSELRQLGRYFALPTFCVIVSQGVFGSVPGNAMGFDTMYFQVAGLGDVRASLLSAARLGASSLGAPLGGAVGDALAHRFPLHGRALAAQISVLSGVPIVLTLFLLLPPAEENFSIYLVLVAMLGLLTSWCSCGVNLPILSEIVEPQQRSVIVAWDRALEGSSAAMFGARLVSLLASGLYGYDIHDRCNVKASDPENARALGYALATATAGPWLVCFLFYSAMHWSYPRDRKLLSKLKALDASTSGALAGKEAACELVGVGGPAATDYVKHYRGL